VPVSPGREVGAGWEPVWEGNGEAQAEIIALALRDSGITAHAQGAQQIQGYPHAFQQATWAVFVPAAHSRAARHLLAERHEGHNIVDLDDDLSSLQRSTLKFVLAGLAAIGAYLAYRALTGGL